MVAERAGTTPPTISKLENGEGTTLEITLRVLRVLGLMDGVVAASDPFGTERGRLMVDEKLPKRVRVRNRDWHVRSNDSGVDVVDFARLNGADPAELWRRAVFGCLIGNLDDHLRNHGFLRRGAGWIVAPAFDVNPEPLGDGNRHQVALFGADELSLASFMSRDALDLFGVRHPAAESFLEQLRPVLTALPTMALVHGADTVSLTAMSSRIDDAVATVA
jgi:transcriptional regulator with XRE-family HTH domain